MKRIINVLWLSLLMLLTATPVSAYDFELDGIQYEITGTNEVCVTKAGDKNSTEIIIPEQVTNDGTTYSVTAIGRSAIYVQVWNPKLASITIPKTIKKIGGHAFGPSVIKNLKEVHISDIAAWCNIEFEDNYANPLNGAGLYVNDQQITELAIPDGVTSISNYAFDNCDGLTSITIPNSVTSIGKSAFSFCDGLSSITIPNSVISIGENAFYRCSSLTAVYISDMAAWCNIDFQSDGIYFEANPLANAHNLYLNGEEITDLVIPDGITSINKYAFYGCTGLTSVTLPNSVTSIGESAFYKCI